ncbi:MAG: quinoprotein relay system zinc metallohydrolase 1 [Burkholderiales bacterium]|nr:quinoprotein relay system zinc metallohydrolase 1 [Burkholderiales bacterium]
MKWPDLHTPLGALLLACALVALAALPSCVQAAPDVAALDYRLQARALAPGVWVVEGANDDFSVANGCNIINTGFIATGTGVVVINTGPSRLYGEQLRALIARTTAEPVVQVLQLNLHPDYFLGHQAFADVPRRATATTRAGVAREAASYENNLYRLCGDWMKGTQTLAPDTELTVPPEGLRWRVGTREFELREWRGHTDSDLVLFDRASGVAFVGGLVFADRVPTTPHARVPEWLASLDALQAQGPRSVVPSHGPVHEGTRGMQQTRRFLQWLDGHFRAAAQQGWEMNELLRAPVPEEFRAWAAFRTEYVRNVAHLYPRYEREALAAASRR